MKKYSIIIAGHRTSVSLETEFWNALRACAKKQDCTLVGLIAKIDAARGMGQNLSSAIRVYVLKQLQKPEE